MFFSLQMCLILSKPEYKLATTPQGLEKGPQKKSKKKNLRKNGSWAKWRPGWRTTLNMTLFDYSSIIITPENIFWHQKGSLGPLAAFFWEKARVSTKFQNSSKINIFEPFFFKIRSKKIDLRWHWHRNAFGPLGSLRPLFFSHFYNFWPKNKKFPNFGALQRRPWYPYTHNFFFNMSAIYPS